MSDLFQELQRLRKTLDTGNMLDLVCCFPTHMGDALERGGDFARVVERQTVGRIVVCGMGGSAIGGDMVNSCLGDGLGVPLRVNRDYRVPASWAEESFFVFLSYSGNTAETLSAYESLRGTGAAAAAITSGGKLQSLCEQDGVPVCSIPGGMPPRAAIAYSFFPLLCILDALGVASLDGLDFDGTQERLLQLSEIYGSDATQNTAADLAGKLSGHHPVVYSGGGLLDPVARRWSCQFNENSEVFSHYGAFPELAHNEIVGWRKANALAASIYVVSLEDGDDHPGAKRQADAALEMIEPLAAGLARIPGFEGGRLERILSAMMLGDFTSVYLAFLNGVDPTPVKNIDLLKKRLG